MTDNPKCLIAVPTLGRPHFLPRILSCFDRLDHDNKKLVIINDDRECKYYTDEKNIEIVNIDSLLTLAVKRNMFASWDFDIMFPLDDDDLFLPERLQNHITQYKKDPELDLFRNSRTIVIKKDVALKGRMVSSFTNSSMTRTGYFKSGGYTNFSRSNHDDICLRENFIKKCKTKIVHDWDSCDFIYQIDGGRYHNTMNKNETIKPYEDVVFKNRKCGDITLNSDHTNYDNIVKISREILENDSEVVIILKDDGSRIEKS